MAKWMRVPIDIPKRFGPTERLAIAQEVIDFIVQRTRSGKAIDGSKFPGYSQSYSKSLNFKIAGKSKSNVDLTLSGDMLDSLRLISQKSGQIIVGYDRADSVNNGKAEGNQLGTYGQKKANTKKARPFLGISRDDLTNILEKYPDSKADSLTRAQEELGAAAESQSLADGIEFNPNE